INILGPTVKLIPLHTNNNENLVGKTVYLTGFGAINDMNVIPKRLRVAILHVDNYTGCFDNPPPNNSEICAASSLSEGKACRGDSGGPLVFLKKKKYYQVGLTSHLALLPICRLKYNNSVHTRVSAYISWISSVTGVNFFRPKKQRNSS
ncbi:chymotrypsin-like elastase family member 1, partial [Agrilus planipennis]|uniref:Chymotrypsin-like elastase family member 1 n=1 Tax=Agrilus planipennis TaxID=224129 RepID=A0A1W4WUH5_AGRPL